MEWQQVAQRDAERRPRVMELLQPGALRSSDDYFHAAFIFQHGDTTDDYRLAHALAAISWKLDPSNLESRWLVAATWDRLLLSQGQPQWYGTQSQQVSHVAPDGSTDTSPWELLPIDENAVTDSERVAMGVPTLAETQTQIEERKRKPPPAKK